MDVEIRVRVRCAGGDYGETCNERAETWASAWVNDDERLVDVDVQTPEGWQFCREAVGWSQGFRCPKHRRAKAPSHG